MFSKELSPINKRKTEIDDDDDLENICVDSSTDSEENETRNLIKNKCFEDNSYLLYQTPCAESMKIS